MGTIFAHSTRYLCIISSKSIGNAIIITPRVVETIKSLPLKEREAISYALVRDLILGVDPKGFLTPMEGILYTMIKYYVTHDTQQRNGALRMAE